MRLGLRLFFAFFVINGLAAFFVLRVFMVEVKPSVRKVTEDTLVETAYALAALASDDMASGVLQQSPADSRFAHHMQAYANQTVKVWIWDTRKTSLDMRVTVTDQKGLVLFDSAGLDQGADYSRWRDVYRTLRGEYGARTTREVQNDEASSVMYVSAPIMVDGRVAGVLTASKPAHSVQKIVDSAESKMLRGGLLFLLLSAGVGFAVTWWLVIHVRRLRSYAQQVQAPTLNEAASPTTAPPMPEAPRMPGELGELARAMEAMRLRVEGREYIEAYVRALTHELKSPLAAIRGAGELLQEPLPEADRQAFAADVLDQTQRLQTMVDQLLELSKLEQLQAPQAPQSVVLADFCKRFVPPAQAARRQIAIETVANAPFATVQADPGLLGLALSNLLENAAAFSPTGSTVRVEVQGTVVSVTDSGPGAPDFALPHLGEKFFSTVRPDGVTKGSGLGLAIVRQIMALHGGRMVVRNTEPGLRVELDFS